MIPVKTEGSTVELATELPVVLVVAVVVVVVGGVVVKTVAFGVVVVAVAAVEADAVLLWLFKLGAEIATHHHYISLDIKSILSMNIN